MNHYRVRFTNDAADDLLRLYDFLLQFDIEVADRALLVIKDALCLLEQFPFSCRKAASGLHGPRIRELVISFGASGYVALFEIDDSSTVTILAVRHQREEDYY